MSGYEAALCILGAIGLATSMWGIGLTAWPHSIIRITHGRVTRRQWSWIYVACNVVLPASMFLFILLFFDR